VGHKNWVKSVRYSHSNETIASGGYDRYLKLWDAETGKMLQEFQDHKGVVNAVRYLPDNKCIFVKYKKRYRKLL
jgi:WD40 repeat protein